MLGAEVQSRGERDFAWVVFFVDDATSVKVQRKEDDALLADTYFQSMGVIGGGETPSA